MASIQDVFTKRDLMQNELFIQELKALPAYHRVAVTGGSRLDMTSYELYKNVDSWWIIALYNDIIDPLTYASERTVLFAPQLSEVEDLINDHIAKGNF